MNEDGMIEQPFEDDMRYEAEDDLNNWETDQVYKDRMLEDLDSYRELDRDYAAERNAVVDGYDLADRAADWVEDYEPRLTCTFADYRYDDNGEWCGAEASEPDAETLGWKQGEGYCYCPDHAWEVLGIPRKETTDD